MRPFVFALILCLPVLVAAGDPVCPQIHLPQQVAPLVAYPQPLLATPLAYPQPLVAPAGLSGTLYGYAAPPAPQHLQANPYRLEPGEMLRDAARLTESAQALAGRSLEVYQRFGVDALAIQAETEQLRARAALIDATRPQSPAALTTSHDRSSSQAITAGGATICIEPDGQGGFVIRVVPSRESAAAATPEPIEPIEAEASPPSADVPEGVRTLAARCASCHTGDTAKGGLVLFADEHTLNPIDSETAGRLLTEALAGRMPPTTNAAGAAIPPLTDRELATLRLLLETD